MLGSEITVMVYERITSAMPRRHRAASLQLAAFLLLALSGCQPAPTVTAPAQPTVSASVTADPTVSASVTAPADPTVVDADQRADIEATGQHRTVLRVSDGDTIVVLPGDKKLDHVRPFTINTPERHVDTNGPADCGADDAWHALQGLLPVGTEVILKGLPGEDAIDRYGRTLANIYVNHDGQLLNVSLWLAEQGWARVFTSYPTSESDAARELQAAAQQNGLGIWKSCTEDAAFPPRS